ncbi:hypothetical protein Epro_0856 [Endomicrobium proavitum]|uniref:Carbohydrate-binding/sugar hydrolysis domain-containing protein n=2 Tax=Endomicrobium proavitum TaxID=1408281 RepID=A0A0G3WK14_9BACT|nr:hypothetical protein Epro_0856 [Endomicrobium proavitum]
MSFAYLSYAKAFPYAGDLSGGINGNDSNWDSYIDLLLPVAGSEKSFLFISPRVSVTGKSVFASNAHETNLGLGFRQYLNILETGAIVGANLYYDIRNSEAGNSFQQAGVGVEFLSRWIDFRANGYIPFANTRYYTGKIYDIPLGHHIAATYGYESSMKGFDGEIGFKIPFPEILGELKIFGGGYYYQTQNNGGDILKGYKGRAEYKPIKILRLNYAVYDNKNFNGANWQAGAEISLPFDFKKLLQAKNPFFGVIKYIKNTPKPVIERMGETVQRDMYVRTAQSRKKHHEDLLLNDNGDEYYFTVVSPNGTGNGTFDNPAGVSSGIALNKLVTESNAALLFLPGQYNQSSEINISGHLSQRVEILAYKSLASKNVALPNFNINEESVINVGSNVNAIAVTGLLTDVYISGFNINNISTNTKSGIYITNFSSGSISVFENTIQGFAKAVEVNSSQRAPVIFDNVLQGNATGIEVYNADAEIYSNDINNNYKYGVNIYNSSGSTYIAGNNIIENSTGVFVNGGIYFVIFQNNISSNSSDGMFISASSNLQIVGNDAYYNGANGIYALNSSSITVASNIISANSGNGIYANNLQNSDINQNTIVENSLAGIYLNASKSVGVSGNEISDNQVGIQDAASQISYISNNYIFNNSSGIFLQNTSNTYVSNNQIFSNVFDGIFVTGGLNATLSMNTVIQNNNGISLYNTNAYTANFNSIAGNLSDGIFVSASPNGKISDNEISQNDGNAITLTNASDVTEISRNTVAGNKTGGIYAQNSSDVIIKANTVRNNTGINGGIFIQNILGSASSVEKNNLSGNQNFAIKSQSSASPISENNITVSSEGHGIWLQDNIGSILSQNILTAQPVGSYFGLYLTGTTVFNSAQSGNNKYYFFESNVYGGDTSPVNNYLSNVYPYDQVIQ